MADNLTEAAVGPEANLTGESIDPTAGMTEAERQAYIQEKLQAIRELQGALEHADFETEEVAVGGFQNNGERTAPHYVKIGEDEHGGIYQQVLSKREENAATKKVPSTRAPKVVKLDDQHRFNEIPSQSGKRIRTPQLRQFRVGYRTKKLDWARWEMELKSLGLARSEEVFPFLGHYCERLDCFERTKGNEAFCSKACEKAVENSRWRQVDLG